MRQKNTPTRVKRSTRNAPTPDDHHSNATRTWHTDQEPIGTVFADETGDGDLAELVTSVAESDEVEAVRITDGGGLENRRGSGDRDLALPAEPGDDLRGESKGSQSSVRHALSGMIDAVKPTGIKGWAWDPNRPTDRVRLVLVTGGEELAVVVADREREDLAAIGIGDGRHGFEIEITDGRFADGQHFLHLRCARTGAALPGSPVTLSVASREPSFRWYIDEITDSQIVGWITAQSDPLNRSVVLLKEGERTLTRALASQFRPDLSSAGIGDGCYGFTLQMPRSLLDGEEHRLDVVENDSGLLLSEGGIIWRSGAGTASPALTGVNTRTDDAGSAEVSRQPVPVAGIWPSTQQVDSNPGGPETLAGESRQLVPAPKVRAGTNMLFDISDLVYYIGHHPNLTGIQRVQSSIALSMIRGKIIPLSAMTFLSYDARARRWTAVPTGFLASLLEDLFLPESRRLVDFAKADARIGLLPGAQAFDGHGVLDDGNPSVLCLLGAAWVQRDYFHRILSFKRRFGTKFVMMVHDLIPIYARETCDQGTAKVFEEFVRRASRHVDHYLSVSEHTAADLRRYLASLSLPEPAVTVTRNGSSFDEFLPKNAKPESASASDLPDRFVLFVSTIEGRKNHQLIFNVWRRLLTEGDDPPMLICVGRVGWKSHEFIADLVETNYLDGRVVLLQEISDAHLKLLYSRCMFTLMPSFYEGWGLPIGESLAMGKICVCSARASLPEVAGDLGVYIDIDRLEHCLQVIRDLIHDAAERRRLEVKIRKEYKPVAWRSVARAIVDACEAATGADWQDPYPYAVVPYSTEISFAWLGREVDGIFGNDLLTRTHDTRRGHFLDGPLQEQSFLRGEDIRAEGAWAEPENWGTWLCHSAGDLVLGLGPSDSVLYFVFLRLRTSGPVANLALRILANGEAMWEGSIGSRSKDIMLRVRRKTRSASGWWQLRLRAEASLSDEVRAQIAAIDSRVPTIGFERLVVIPEHDVKARLDALVNLLL